MGSTFSKSTRQPIVLNVLPKNNIPDIISDTIITQKIDYYQYIKKYYDTKLINISKIRNNEIKALYQTKLPKNELEQIKNKIIEKYNNEIENIRKEYYHLLN